MIIYRYLSNKAAAVRSICIITGAEEFLTYVGKMILRLTVHTVFIVAAISVGNYPLTLCRPTQRAVLDILQFVCLSVCPSVTSRRLVATAKRIELFSCGTAYLTWLWKRIRVSRKIWVHSCGNLSQSLEFGLEKISPLY